MAGEFTDSYLEKDLIFDHAYDIPVFSGRSRSTRLDDQHVSSNHVFENLVLENTDETMVQGK